MNNTQQLESSIMIGDEQSVRIDQQIIAPLGLPAVNIIGEEARLDVISEGVIIAADEGNTGVVSSGNNVNIVNSGQIAGALNGISSSGNGLNLFNRRGVITSDSRAVDITDGDNITVVNSSTILGTGNQRNGTFYVDGTVDNLNLDNRRGGTIDAGEGNIGDGISVQVGDGTEDALNENINIVNGGTIAGRGQAAFAPVVGRLTANGSSGVRFFNGLEEGEATVTGVFNNVGTISAEVNVGFLGGFVVEDGVGFAGEIINRGLITAPNNGLYIGEAEHQLSINNLGRIESGSRAVNLDGDNITFRNIGEVIGIDDQRDGTLYVDGTGDNITINNTGRGTIDAGVGNSGSGVSIQVGSASGDLETSANLINNGLIQGRGTENVPAGVRLFLGSGLDEATFTGNITNQARSVIASEQDAGILIEEGVIFNGQIINNGDIRGGNGLAIDARGTSDSVAVINNGRLEGEVLLGNGNDSFRNNSRDSLSINAGGGNDTLTGGAGINTYDFELGSGEDIITDFQAGQGVNDILELGAYFSDINEVLGSTSQVRDDTLINLSDDDSLTLANFDAGDLTVENFSFV